MTIDETRLKEIEDRCEKATPGPWKLEIKDEFWPSIYGPNREMVVLANDCDGGGFHSDCKSDEGNHQPNRDANFCTHARQDVPDLVAEVRRLQKLVSKYGWIEEAINDRQNR